MIDSLSLGSLYALEVWDDFSDISYMTFALNWAEVYGKSRYFPTCSYVRTGRTEPLRASKSGSVLVTANQAACLDRKWKPLPLDSTPFLGLT
jgi:hypothetical protein